MSALEQRLSAVWVAGLAAVLIGFAWPLFTGEVYFARDLQLFHLPLRHFHAQALAAGHSFVWFPYAFCGFYLHGDGQLALYHPLNWLLYASLPFGSAFTLEVVRSYAFALAGSYLFLRRWRLRRDAALLGAALFAFSSFNVLSYPLINAVAVAAHIPWLLWAVDLAVRGARRRAALALAAVALLTGSQLLLSHPQTAWMSLVAITSYGALLLGPAVAGRRGAAARTVGLRQLAALVAAVAIGALLAGVQLVPQWEALGTSRRSAPDEQVTSAYPLQPLFVLQLLAPYAFRRQVPGLPPTGFALYCGVAAPLLLAWLVVARRRLAALAPLAWGAVALGALALWLSLGDAGLLYRLQQWLPVVGLFRAPGRYIVLFQLSVAVAAAIAYHDLAGIATSAPRQGRGVVALFVPVAASVLVSGVLVTPAVSHALALRLPHPGMVALGPALLLLAAGCLTLALRGRPAALYAFAALVALDLGGFALSYVWRSERVDLDALAARPVPPLGRGYRLELGHPTLTMQGVRLASGYAALQPGGILPLGQPAFAGVSAESRRAALRVAGIDPGAGAPAPLARARLLAAAVASDDVRSDLARVDVGTTALVARPLAGLAGAPGAARIVRDAPGAIEVATRAEGRQLLVVAERFHEGWRGIVDGSECDVIRVYGDFMGCVVAAGSHTVAFRFAPTSLRTGAWLTGLGLVALVAWTGWLLRPVARRAR